MYSNEFCRVYNLFGWNYFPEIFGEQLLQWFEERNFFPKSCLDLGCGTGVLCKLLSEQGITAAGIDLSEGMIAIAKENDSASHYEAANMVTYRPESPVDLITCTGDALNHIESLADVKEIFVNAYDSLNPGGYLIFDLLNEGEISSDEPFELPFDEKTTARFQMLRKGQTTVELHIAVYENGTLQFEEVITETVHDAAVIEELLKEAGFHEVSCSHRLLQHAEEAATWFFVCRKLQG